MEFGTVKVWHSNASKAAKTNVFTEHPSCPGAPSYLERSFWFIKETNRLKREPSCLKGRSLGERSHLWQPP